MTSTTALNRILKIIDDYKWLERNGDGATVEPVSNIIAPYIDRHGERVELSVNDLVELVALIPYPSTTEKFEKYWIHAPNFGFGLVTQELDSYIRVLLTEQNIGKWLWIKNEGISYENVDHEFGQRAETYLTKLYELGVEIMEKIQWLMPVKNGKFTVFEGSPYRVGDYIYTPDMCVMRVENIWNNDIGVVYVDLANNRQAGWLAHTVLDKNKPHKKLNITSAEDYLELDALVDASINLNALFRILYHKLPPLGAAK